MGRYIRCIRSEGLIVNNTLHGAYSYVEDSSIAVKTGGCFPGSSTVLLEDGRHSSMSNLSTGDRVLAVDRNGAPLYATVIGFLHRDVNKLVSFLTLWTD